jgi:hypothetical protein
MQVMALLNSEGDEQLCAELVRDVVQQQMLPADMQLCECKLMLLADATVAAASQLAAAPGGGVWCQPAAFTAAQAAGPAGSPQELMLHVPQQLLAVTAAAGRGVRVVLSDGATSAAVLDRKIAADDAAWPRDGVLRLQLPPCQGPLVLLHLLSTAPAGAAQHAADELLATAALLALPSAPACSEVNSMFDRMQQEVQAQAQAQAQGAADGLLSASLVFNNHLRAFVMDCVQLLAPGSSPEEQDLERHMQTFLALHGMHSCLQLLRAAGVHVSSKPGLAPAVVAVTRSSSDGGSSDGRLEVSGDGEGCCCHIRCDAADQRGLRLTCVLPAPPLLLPCCVAS